MTRVKVKESAINTVLLCVFPSLTHQLPSSRRCVAIPNLLKIN